MYKKLILLLIVILFFFINFLHIGNSSEYAYDEIYYIPAAKEMLNGNYNVNIEHPPLGKMLIAASVRLIGDRNYGWRILPLAFATGGLICTYALSKNLFNDFKVSILSVILVATNGLWNQYAKLATLDVFVSFYLILGFLSLWEYLDKKKLKYLIFLGIAIGIGGSIKLLSFFYIPGVIFLIYLKNYISIKSNKHLLKQLLIFLFTTLISYIIPLLFIFGTNANKLINSQFKMLFYSTNPFGFEDPNEISPENWFLLNSNLGIKNFLIYLCLPIIVFLLFELIKNLKTKNLDGIFKIMFILVSFTSLYAPWFLLDRPTYSFYTIIYVPLLSISLSYILVNFKNVFIVKLIHGKKRK